MAFKFKIIIDYPEELNHEMYLKWLADTIGNETFIELATMLDNDHNTGNMKFDRVDNTLDVTMWRYYTDETQAIDMHNSISTLLENIGVKLLISDILTITDAEYDAVVM